MGSVDFSDGSAVSLSLYRLLSKLRCGRQQQVTVGALEQMQESGNKVSKKQKIVENWMQLQNSCNWIKSRPPCKSMEHGSRIRHKHCYFWSGASHCFEFFHYKNKSPDWLINQIVWVFSLSIQRRILQEQLHSVQRCHWLRVQLHFQRTFQRSIFLNKLV